jgi:hypothetical protein
MLQLRRERGEPMGKINVTRVIGGGLVAGVVLNLGQIVNGILTGEALGAHMASLGISNIPALALAPLIATTTATGILLVWLYAAIRPRFGAGIKTALIAAFVLWLVGGLFSSIMLVTFRFFPSGTPLVLGTAWSLIEYCLAAIAGAWLYKEETLL